MIQISITAMVFHFQYPGHTHHTYSHTQSHIASHKYYNKWNIQEHGTEECQQENCQSQSWCNLMHFHYERSSGIFWRQHKTRGTIQKCQTPISPATNTHKHNIISNKWLVPHSVVIQPESVHIAVHWACSEGHDVLWSDIYDRLHVMQKISHRTLDFEDVIAPVAATYAVPNIYFDAES